MTENNFISFHCIVLLITSDIFCIASAKSTCKEGAWMCSNGRCLRFEHRCDGTDDCGDSSDETRCTTCKDGSWMCNNGRCLNTDNKCDGVDDCGDVSDEIDCKYLSSQSIIAIIVGILLVLIFIGAVVVFIIHQKKKLMKLMTSQRSQKDNDKTVKDDVHYDYPMTGAVGHSTTAATDVQDVQFSSIEDEDGLQYYDERLHNPNRDIV